MKDSCVGATTAVTIRAVLSRAIHGSLSALFPSFLSRSRGTKISRAAFATSNNHSNTDRTFKQCAGGQTVPQGCRYNNNSNHLAYLLKDCLKAGARRHLNRTNQCNIAKGTIRDRGNSMARGQRRLLTMIMCIFSKLRRGRYDLDDGFMWTGSLEATYTAGVGSLSSISPFAIYPFTF